jgi:hypothetical protein
MRRNRSSAGVTIVEIAIGVALSTAVLGGAGMMLSSTGRVAQSTNDGGVASNRAAEVLDELGDALRRGSLASLRRADGTAFADGGTDSGFQVRQVASYSGGQVLAAAVTYRFEPPSGDADGVVLRAEGAFETIVARGVTAFTVSRAGTLFTLNVRTRSGPADDRGRTQHAVLQVAARNP